MLYRAHDLGYCSNVHAGEDWQAVRRNLLEPVRAVRERRGLDRMAAGLWLSAAAATELASDPAPLGDALAQAGVDLVTLNGFPFGNFHAARVKAGVYRPGWDLSQRRQYTLALAKILARCLPSDAPIGTISTLPLGYAQGWNAERDAAALAQLCLLAAELGKLADETGRQIRVCLEPEPDCALQTTAQAVALFTERLPTAARGAGVALDDLSAHLGLCFDVCHQAVQFEDIGRSLADLDAAGVVIGKMQVSSALDVEDPAHAAAALAPFAEPRYLHQVRCRAPDGGVSASPDLETALADPGFPRSGRWRVHFHVPIQETTPGTAGLGATTDAIDAMLLHLAQPSTPSAASRRDTQRQPRPQLEVETYTWQVLPEAQRPHDEASLVAGLAAELDWLETRMTTHRLLDAERNQAHERAPR
ncbi:metabolite traffic protein EboE [Thiohalocapsa sp. ML1]|uniref:metabolite traffic protein EboE n=1 Tax=Thiohalocapsa sp. ML1 TaxID=1431688 RepID=UPI00073204D0|nr:metabolite traffic protein EboE [Thiohalocapsa sp. ML1]